jgi:hypothetical protein
MIVQSNRVLFIRIVEQNICNWHHHRAVANGTDVETKQLFTGNTLGLLQTKIIPGNI